MALAFDNQCAAPAFNPAPGLYNTAQSVTITTTTGGATIRYTTDGSTPSESAGTVYSSAVNISANTTLKAITYNTGMVDSGVTSGFYTITSRALPRRLPRRPAATAPHNRSPSAQLPVGRPSATRPTAAPRRKLPARCTAVR